MTSWTVFQPAPQDPGVKREKPGGTECRRREDRGAEGGRVWGGGVPLPTGEGVWGGDTEIFSIFELKKRPLMHSGCYFCS